MVNRSNNTSSSHPGKTFSDSYATVCLEMSGETLYSSFKTEESLASYLEGRDVTAVRINSVETPEIGVEVELEERDILDDSGETKAVAYLDPEAPEDTVVFGESEQIE